MKGRTINKKTNSQKRIIFSILRAFLYSRRTTKGHEDTLSQWVKLLLFLLFSSCPFMSLHVSSWFFVSLGVSSCPFVNFVSPFNSMPYNIQQPHHLPASPPSRGTRNKPAMHHQYRERGEYGNRCLPGSTGLVPDAVSPGERTCTYN